MASALNTIALVFGVGIAGYFMVKVVLPKLMESGNIQLPSFQMPMPQQPQPQQPIYFPTNSEITNPAVASSSFTFNVVGDSRSDDTAAGRCVCGDNPTLVLLTGDFMQGGPASQWQKTYSACSGRLNKIFASRGNHDGSGADYLNIFPLNKKSWSSMHKQGPIAFIACDTISDNPAKEEPLFQQAQNDPAIKNIVVIMHEPIFTIGASSDSSRSYHAMFSKYSKVKLVIAGHNHYYYRLKPINNILYVTNGTGGGANGASTFASPGTEIHALGCLKCRVSAGGGINCQWVSNDGKIGDQFAISDSGKITASGGEVPKGTGTAAYMRLNKLYQETDPMATARYLQKPKRIFNNYIYNFPTITGSSSGLNQQRALEFIRNSFKPNIGMLEEAPGFNVFWLWNDQLLGQLALKSIDPNMARIVESRMNSFGVPMRTPWATLDPKYRKNFSIHHASEPTISTNPMIRYSDYGGSGTFSYTHADIAFLSAINYFYQNNIPKAREAYEAGRKMWDGVGMRDGGNITGDYAVYKIALGLLAEKITGFPKIGIPENYFAKFQHSNGGIITDIIGGKPAGSQNIETTAAVLFALNPSLLGGGTKSLFADSPVSNSFYNRRRM